MAAKRPPMRRGNSARPLLAAALPDHRRGRERPEVRRLQQLLADVGSAVGRIGGVEPDRPVVVDEADEARVLHAGRLGAHRRPQHPLGKRYLVGEFDGVEPLGDGPNQRDRLLRVAAGAHVRLERVELFVEVGSGEPVTECVENVVGSLAPVAKPRELTAEHGSVEQRRPDRSDGGEPSRSVDRDAALGVDHARPKPDR